jgi:hypothetical protein
MPSGIGVAGAGAALTSEQVARILVNPLQARSVVLAAGRRVFDSQGDPLSIPKLAPMSTVGMTAENVAVPSPTPVFSEVQALPASLKSFQRGYASQRARAPQRAGRRHRDGPGTSGTSGTTWARAWSPVSTTCWMPRGRCWPPTPAWTAPPVHAPRHVHPAAQDPGGLGTGTYMLMNGVAGIAEGTVTDSGPPPAAGRPAAGLHPGAGRPGRRQAHPGRHEPGRRGPRHRPSLGVFTETFADSDQLYLRVVARYDIKPLNAAGIYIITTA